MTMTTTTQRHRTYRYSARPRRRQPRLRNQRLRHQPLRHQRHRDLPRNAPPAPLQDSKSLMNRLPDRLPALVLELSRDRLLALVLEVSRDRLLALVLEVSRDRLLALVLEVSRAGFKGPRPPPTEGPLPNRSYFVSGSDNTHVVAYMRFMHC